MIDIDRLRWFIRWRDVTCENCHTAIYRPRFNDEYQLCPTCRHALGEDLLEVHAGLADQAELHTKAGSR